MAEYPWARAIPEKYIPGHIIKGTIAKVTNFGAFVELEPDLEGLLHISELADHKIDKPQDIVKAGDEVEVKILRVDNEARKIGLSLRRVQWAAEEQAAEADLRKESQGQLTRPIGVQTVVSDANMDQIVKPQDKAAESEEVVVEPAESGEQEAEAVEAEAVEAEAGDTEAGDTGEPQASSESEQTEAEAVEAQADDAAEAEVSEKSKQGQTEQPQDSESTDSDPVRSESDSSSAGGALGTSNEADSEASGDSSPEKETDSK